MSLVGFKVTPTEVHQIRNLEPGACYDAECRRSTRPRPPAIGAAAAVCGVLLLSFSDIALADGPRSSVSPPTAVGPEGRALIMLALARRLRPAGTRFRPMTGPIDQLSWFAGERPRGAARSLRRSKGRRWS